MLRHGGIFSDDRIIVNVVILLSLAAKEFQKLRQLLLRRR